MPNRTHEEHLKRVRPRALQKVLHRHLPKDWMHRVVWTLALRTNVWAPICWKCAGELTRENKIDPTVAYWEIIRSAGTVRCSHCKQFLAQHPVAQKQQKRLREIKGELRSGAKRDWKRSVNELKAHLRRLLAVKSIPDQRLHYLQQCYDLLELSLLDLYAKREAARHLLGGWDATTREFREERDFDLEPGLFEKTVNKRAKILYRARQRVASSQG